MKPSLRDGLLIAVSQGKRRIVFREKLRGTRLVSCECPAARRNEPICFGEQANLQALEEQGSFGVATSRLWFSLGLR